MSGITPILDTLLHQVLGKRVDVPVARQTPEPVRPLSPADAPPAVRSDSRLDPRSAPLPDLPMAGQRGRAVPAPLLPANSAGGSTQTHFSAAARTIADILARYPAPPSAVRPASPLMDAADTKALSLASRLQTSFSQSGLFYESHLQGWYRGEVSGARLSQEPQMRLTRPAPEGRPVGHVEDVVRPAPQPLPDDTNQALQGILRHQLETLATPVLRWEGDVWSGIFMALMVQAPAEAPRQPRGGDGQGHDSEGEEQGEEGVWRSDLTIDLAALGPVRVRLDMRGDNLRIDLDTGSVDIAGQLRAGGDRLKSTLREHGFEQVQLRVTAESPGDE